MNRPGSICIDYPLQLGHQSGLQLQPGTRPDGFAYRLPPHRKRGKLGVNILMSGFDLEDSSISTFVFPFKPLRRPAEPRSPGGVEGLLSSDASTKSFNRATASLDDLPCSFFVGVRNRNPFKELLNQLVTARCSLGDRCKVVTAHFLGFKGLAKTIAFWQSCIASA